MGYINLPPTLKGLFDDLANRVKKLETSQRFTAPNVVTDPANPRKGDIWLNTTSNTLKWYDNTSVTRTLPANAYQFAAKYSAATPCLPTTDMIWDVVVRNVGSAYNATNGKFTAPVAGTYFFTAHNLWANADTGDLRIAFYINGGAQAIRTINYKTVASWQTWHLNGTFALSAGDYVTVRYEQGTTAQYGDQNYNDFQGWLVA